MNKEKKARLEAHGWRVGLAEEFLGMTPEEAAYVDLRLAQRRGPRVPQEEAPDPSSTRRVAPIQSKSRRQS